MLKIQKVCNRFYELSKFGSAKEFDYFLSGNIDNFLAEMEYVVSIIRGLLKAFNKKSSASSLSNFIFFLKKEYDISSEKDFINYINHFESLNDNKILLKIVSKFYQDLINGHFNEILGLE